MDGVKLQDTLCTLCKTRGHMAAHCRRNFPVLEQRPLEISGFQMNSRPTVMRVAEPSLKLPVILSSETGPLLDKSAGENLLHRPLLLMY